MKRQLKRQVKTGLLIVTLLCGCIVCSGCGQIAKQVTDVVKDTVKDIGTVGFEMDYENEEKYLAGDAELENTINAIAIDWYGGDIQVAYYDGDTVSISETATKDGEALSADELASQDLQLRYYADDGTLRIHFLKKGKYEKLDLSKELKILLPKSCALKKIDCDVVDGDVSLRELMVKRVVMDSVDGDLRLEKVTAAEIEMNSVDGSLYVDDGTPLERLEMNSVDGDAEIFLPKEGNFTVKMGTVSGRFESDFDVKADEDREEFICGNGEKEWRFDSVDGDITIRKK